MNRPKIDTRLLFATRIARLFCYGFLSIALALYLAQVGLSDGQIGLLFTLTLAGDAGISLWLTTTADRFGRKKTLILGALLMIFAGLVFAFTSNPALLMIAAIVGVVSPSGNEIGPFLSIEQAALSQLLPDEKRTQVFAWYNLVGSFATATGALCGGLLAQALQTSGMGILDSYRVIVIGYATGGAVLAALFLFLSPAVEWVQPVHAAATRRVLGLHRSRGVVARLSALFALDAFAGGFVVQSIIAYWFHVRYGVDIGVLGSIFFGANLLAGISALLAVRMSKRFGLINTMVYTHVPSNILLYMVPLMPSLPLAVGVLLLRFSISQMDVPTRQSYTMAVVEPDERSAASGITSIARSVGAAISPALSGLVLSNPIGIPFFLAGGLKLVYDFLLYRSFNSNKPPEESVLQQSTAK
ncbi:MAG TPA: MFS transporter [Anaerolineae bacterium]